MKNLRTLFIIALLIFSGLLLSQTEINVPALEEISEVQSILYQQKKTNAGIYADANNIPIREELNDGRILEMMYLDIFGLPQYYTTNNSNAAISIGTVHAFPGGSLGADLDGEGMTLYQWDGGKIYYEHPELLGRAFPSDQNNSNSRHATHVAGTMVGSGVNPLARGMAPKAILLSYNWNNDIAEMAMEASRGALLSNHSYGYIRGWYYANGIWLWAGNPDISVAEDYLFGFYDENTRLFDEIAYSAPNYLIVKSAGNDRGNGSVIENPPYPVDGPYDCLPQVATAKNILTVGAVFDLPEGYKGPSSVDIAPFSSWGPADDGRIKPDIVANGIGLLSCIELTSLYTQEALYAKYSGTSMAAPSVTGSLGLIQEHYQNINGTGNFMLSATLKALVIQTADEAGTGPGPDYSFGWGLMNTTKALLKISEDQVIDVISEHVLDENQAHSREVYVSGNKPLKVTVVWTDFPGAPASPQLDPLGPMLVNDLDLKITMGGNTWFPWKLDRDNPANPASNNTKNDVDNVEVVVIENPIPGNYVITVDHDGSLTNGSQAFSMIVDGISENDPPLAGFYYTAGIEGNLRDVQFMDASFGEPVNWSWSVLPNSVSFIGGTNASSPNPIIRFDEPNCYDVTLTVSNSSGTHQVTRQVCVEPFPCNYCSSSYANVPDTFVAIKHVSFNTISNSSGNFAGLVGYEDYTGIPTDVFRLSTVKLEVKVSLSFPGIFSGYCIAWIDWNQDCDFDDPGEEYNVGSFIDSDVIDLTDPLSLDIMVPGTALKGKTRMRVAVREGLAPAPCTMGPEKGEVEDYTIVVHYSDYPGFWTGLSSSEWGRASNWSGGILPDANIVVSIPKDVPRFPALDRGLVINQNAIYDDYECKSLTLENGARLAGSLFNEINVYGDLTLRPNSVLSNPQSLRIYPGGNLLMDSASIKPSYISGQGNTSAGVFLNDGSSVSLTNSNITFGQFLKIGQNVNWAISGQSPFYSLFYNALYSSNIENNSNTVYFDDFTIRKGTTAIYKTTSSNDFEVSRLTVEPDARFTLENGNGMLIYNSLVLKDERYEPTGSFINEDIVQIEDEEVFAGQYLEDNRWHFTSSPVIGAQSGIFTGIYMKFWDETSYAWDYITATDVPLVPGAGFEVWSTLGDPMVTYAGTGFVDTDVTLPLTATDYNNDSNIGLGEGWNLVGNPFTSAMDWGTGNDPVAGYDLLGLDNSIYLWNGSQYASFNPAGDGVGVNGGTRYIPSMQSFFVKANYFSPQITLPASARVHSPQPNYKGGNSLNPHLRLTVKGPGYSDETLIRVIEGSTIGFDGLYDGYKLDGIEEAPQLFSFFGDDRYSINTLPAISRDLIVPLGLTSGTEDTFVLEISELRNFRESVTFYLEEIETGLFYEIKEGFSFSLQMGPADKGHRFNLHFKDGGVEGSDNDIPGIKVYSGPGTIFVYSLDTDTYNVRIFDMIGQLVIQDKPSAVGLKTFRLNRGTGNYIVKVYNDARVFTRKVFVP